MEKVLIIGVNSFLGESLVKLLKADFKIDGIYNRNVSNLDKEVNNVHISQLFSLKDDYKYVFYISAYVPDKNGIKHQLLYDINVDLLNKTLNIFKKAKFVLASTVSVYGKIEVVIDENSPGYNLTPYGLSKLWAESLVKQRHSYAILRISSMYGIGMKLNTFLPVIVKNAITNSKITLFGDGSRKQNYIHVDDAARQFYAAALKDENGTYLCVSEKSCSNHEIAQIVQKNVDGTSVSFSGEDNDISYIYDAKNTYSRLNYTTSIDIEEGIKELVLWIRKGF